MTLLSRPLPARPLPPRPAALPVGPSANATLAARRDVGRSAALLTVTLDAPLAGYRAGQYVALGLSDAPGAAQRPYSVVSAAAEGQAIELFVRLVPAGVLTPRLWQVRAGDRLHVGRPRGMFVFDDADWRRPLLVGAGTGIAPLLAMLEHAARQGERRSLTLVHGVSFADELVFGERLAAWRGMGLQLDYRPTVSRPADPANDGWRGRVGRAEAELEAALDEDGCNARTVVGYLCGNPHMVDACTRVLVGVGVPGEAIRAERF